MEKITSRQNPKISEACALQKKKCRDESGEFFFEGIKLLREAQRENVNIVRVFVTAAAIDAYGDELSGEFETVEVSDSVFEKLTTENAPQGVFTVARMFAPKRKQTGLSIILDALSDPGNLGTVIRCADAFGVEKIYLSDTCADVYNPKTVRAAMGSVFRVPTERGDIEKKIKELQNNGYSVYAAMLDENALRAEETEKDGKTAFVIGNEGHGVSKSVRDACDGSVFIPMREDSAESLNASVAAAILMWEHKKI